MSRKLQKYRLKRNFKISPEPKGKKTKPTNRLFLIQKHAASHLHYDFRLALGGVLKSWAIPKGPSLDPAIKRLAVHVEDHPIEYGSFEGIIPAGQYGGGVVMLWDTGEWECADIDPNAAYNKGSLTFSLKGKKLKGLWKLIMIKSDPKNWLLIKIPDKYARPSDEYNIIEAKPNSVVSRRSLEGIASHFHADPPKKYHSDKSTNKITIKIPATIHPALASLVTTPPNNKDWLHEVKFDGYRLITFVQNNIVKLITRNQHDWTNKFPFLANSIKKLNLKNAILDGELVALDNNDHSDFQLLQNSIHNKNTSKLVYYVFDLLYLDNTDLTKLPLIERKKILRSLIHTSNSTILYSDHIIGKGQELFKKSCKLGLEGIISKNIHSQYIQKRSHEWVKSKCVQRQEFIIIGFTPPSGQRQYFGSLLLAINIKNNRLKYCGNVGTGFTDESLKEIYEILLKNQSNKMPLPSKPAGLKSITWVKPNIIAEVEFTSWTNDELLRNPSFKGIRNDKKSSQIIHEKPEKITMKPTIVKTADYHLSNPDRILYPEKGITKQDLADYYSTIHEWILPHIIKRPLTILRCPKNRMNCFFQKHLNEIKEKDIYTNESYLYIKNKSGLLSLVQLGVLEIHSWGCHIEHLEKPDLMIFDLDPAPDVEWKKVISAAYFVKDQLKKYNLISFVKTTGGKGLHVAIPLKRKYGWREIEIFAHTFADYLVSLKPDMYIATMSKAKRKGKIFIDYLRNLRGATSIAPYSTRARENAPVSTPLHWDELSEKLKSDSYTINTIPERLKKLKSDPWKDFFKINQTLKLP